jgi:hypothetical protein
LDCAREKAAEAVKTQAGRYAANVLPIIEAIKRAGGAVRQVPRGVAGPVEREIGEPAAAFRAGHLVI